MTAARYPADLTAFVSAELAERANPAKAAPMAAYMKTDMPFYGVQKPGRVEILREMKRRWPFDSRSRVERAVRALWRLPHREEKYLAIAVTQVRPELMTVESLPLYEKLIREGAWWDFVDEVAIGLVGHVWRESPGDVAPVMDEWIEDDDFWIRRTALIAQVNAKGATDWRRLGRYCRLRLHEKEFFIRKAIGWALRSYAATNPERVAAFLRRHESRLSGLTYREAAKGVIRAGVSI